MTAWNSDRHREVSLGDRATPDFVAALALADEIAPCGAQKVAQRFVELRRHLRGGGFRFAERRDLQKQISGIDLGMIVGQQIERHGGNLR